MIKGIKQMRIYTTVNNNGYKMNTYIQLVLDLSLDWHIL